MKVELGLDDLEKYSNLINGYGYSKNKWALDKNIKNELPILLIISSLCAKTGTCFASNEYFSKIFDIDTTRISKKIKKLEKEGYLNIEYKRRGTEIQERIIEITQENLISPLSKMTTDHCQNCQPTIVKNDKDNNISINNISNNNKKEINKEKSAKNKFIKPSLEEIINYCTEKNYCIDAKQFFNYYEDSEWKDLYGNPIINWKNKAYRWHVRELENKNKTNTNNNFSPAPKRKMTAEEKITQWRMEQARKG